MVDARVAMVDVFKRARENVENTMVELDKIAKAQLEVKKTHKKYVDNSGKELVQKHVVWSATAPESHITFRRMRDEAVGQATLRIAEHDSANKRYHEVLKALRRFVKELKDRKGKTANTPVKPNELVDQGREVPVTTHQAKLVRIRIKVASSMSGLGAKVHEFQTLPV